MFSLFKFATLAALATSAFVSVSAAPLQERAASVAITWYHSVDTVPGETVLITGSIPQLGNWAPAAAKPLSDSAWNVNTKIWQTTLQLPSNTQLQYKFIIKRKDGSISWEAGSNRLMNTGASGGNVRTSWNDMRSNAPFDNSKYQVTFQHFVRPAAGSVWIVGGHPSVGNWDIKKAVQLGAPSATNNAAPIYQLALKYDAPVRFEYKFVVRRPDGKYIWEGGANRVVNLHTPGVVKVADLWRDDNKTPALANPGGPDVGESAAFFIERVQTKPGEKVYIVGDRAKLGAWNPANAVPLSSLGYTDAAPYWWTVTYLPAGKWEYKLIKKVGDKVVWESGVNRVLNAASRQYHRVEDVWRN